MDSLAPPGAMGAHLVSAGSAFAGFVLVFLGLTISAYAGYDATQQRAVRRIYRARALHAFIGFISASATVACGVLSEAVLPDIVIFTGLACLALSMVMTLRAACSALLDLL
ncbi:MAG: hypothetical protein AB7K52_16060 [Phycisphaerales bacterium]